MSRKHKARNKKPFLLYHWSPVARRQSIEQEGLKIGSEHVIHTPGWQADYLCFSNSPSMAWALSGDWSDEGGEWDLWMVWSTNIDGVYKRGDHVGDQVAEFRTFRDVPAKSMWLVGQRVAEAKRSKKNG